jgi:putative tryptophan/tyrosine transport system substrate-binding protein
MAARIASFRQRLNELGWVDGCNLRLDVRWSNLDPDRVRAQAKELVNLAPDVIVATNSLTLGPLAQATSAIPLVFVNVSDPVGLGFVDSLARPGANITGFTNFEFSTGGRWLELLKDMAPRVTRVGVVFNPLTTSSSRFFLHSLEAAAPAFNVKLVARPLFWEGHVAIARDAREAHSRQRIPFSGSDWAHCRGSCTHSSCRKRELRVCED